MATNGREDEEAGSSPFQNAQTPLLRGERQAYKGLKARPSLQGRLDRTSLGRPSTSLNLSHRLKSILLENDMQQRLLMAEPHSHRCSCALARAVLPQSHRLDPPMCLHAYPLGTLPCCQQVSAGAPWCHVRYCEHSHCHRPPELDGCCADAAQATAACHANDHLCERGSDADAGLVLHHSQDAVLEAPVTSNRGALVSSMGRAALASIMRTSLQGMWGLQFQRCPCSWTLS